MHIHCLLIFVKYSLRFLLFVAVTGLPNPRKDHAVVMVKFAKEMLLKMAAVTSHLETVLGPGTSALTARVGVSQRI